MNRKINKVAVIGSGVMGSGIACHFANIGVEVLLLDISPTKLNENEEKLGLSLEDKKVKNRIVNEMFQRCIKSKPAPLYHKNFSKRVELGNLTDDLKKISNVDWIIEVVTEKLNIKQDPRIDSLLKTKIENDRERFRTTYFTLQLYSVCI